MNEKMTVAKYLVSLIAETGVKTIPVMQGGVIMKIIDEIGQHPDLEYICPNHEQALAMMVEAYARINGFGIGMATSGPGGTNLITGVACAFYDSIPCLFVTGQVGMFHLKNERGVRQRGFQETDIVSVMKPITKYVVLLDNPQDVRYVFEKCVYVAKSGRPGPVLIDLPYNIQRAVINPENLIGYNPQTDPDLDQGLFDKPQVITAIGRVIEELKTAQRPVVLVGGGVWLSHQAENVKRLISLLGIPVVATWAALDIFEPENPYYFGAVGRNGHRSAVEIIQQSDLLISLGARFTPKEIINEKIFAKNAKIVSVDIDRSELNEGLISPHIKVRADLRVFVPMLLEAAISGIDKSDLAVKGYLSKEVLRVKEEKFETDITFRKGNKKYVSPYDVAEILSELLVPPAIWVSDIGMNSVWMTQGYRHKPGVRFIGAWGNGPMGYALPASVGAYYASKDSMIIVTTGDGGMQINIQELQTIAANRIPVKIFILNNKCYANIKMGARREFEGRTHASGAGFGYSVPDFVKVAEAYGIKAFNLVSGDNLEYQIYQALSSQGPVLVNVDIDPDQDAPDNSDFLAEISARV